METSESITKIAPALLAAQKKVEGAVKDSENPHFKSRYADLASVMDACKAPLNEAGISIVQTTVLGEGVGSIILETTLLHESGEWIRGTLRLPTIKDDPQAAGSALTYARRYALAAIIGVCPEDDDAEGAMPRPANGKPASVPRAPAKPSAAPKGLEPVMGFASGKGKTAAELDDKSLDFYIRCYTENLHDPNKARFKDANYAILESLQAEKAKREGGIQDDPLEEVFGGGKGSVARQYQPPTKPDKAAWVRSFRDATDHDSLKGLIAALKLMMDSEPEETGGPYTELFRDRDIIAAFTKRDQELR